MAMMLWGSAAVMTLAGCSKDATDAKRFGDGDGSLVISALPRLQMAESAQTRASQKQIPLTEILGADAAAFNEEWAMSSLRTRVQCIVKNEAGYYDDGESYGSANAFNDERPRLTAAADYMVTMGSLTDSRKRLPSYVAPDGSDIPAEDAPLYRAENPDNKLVPKVDEGEGAGFVYFEGCNTVNIESDSTVDMTVDVKVANAAVTVKFSEAFRNYFAKGAVTLTTKNGLTTRIAEFDGDGDAAQHYIWVRPQQFTLSAAATPKDAPSPGQFEAEEIAFDDCVRADSDVDGQTLYTFVYDVKAGGASGRLTITVNDEPVGEVELGSEETNPNDENYQKE